VAFILSLSAISAETARVGARDVENRSAVAAPAAGRAKARIQQAAVGEYAVPTHTMKSRTKSFDTNVAVRLLVNSALSGAGFAQVPELADDARVRWGERVGGSMMSRT